MTNLTKRKHIIKRPKKKKSEADKTNHYVDNEKFLEAMVAYKKEVEEAENCGDEQPPIPEYIAECIMKIATHLAYKPNFQNYTYREDMISDGVENCLMYLTNFDPEKSKNPFSYFTQIIYYAFLRRLAREEKHQYTKMKATYHSMVFGESTHIDRHDTGKWVETQDGIPEWTKEYMDDFISDFEKKLKEKKENAKKKKEEKNDDE